MNQTEKSVLPSEIQDRIERSYLDRLDQRVRQMRLFLARKDWKKLRAECQHLKNTARTFGFEEISILSEIVLTHVPESIRPYMPITVRAKQSLQSLFLEIDRTLYSHSSFKSLGTTIWE